MIRAVIFDMDGVLIDAREWHYVALNQALGLFGFQIGREEHLTTFDGLPTRVKLEKLTRMRGLPRGLHSLINELKQAYTAQLASLHCGPIPAHQDALSRLRTLGYRLAVASNSIRSTVDLMLGRAGLLPFLDFTLSNEDVEQPKPAPEIYERAIACLGLSPRECLVVEDNENGIAAGLASGAHVMVVHRTDDVNFDSVIARIRQLDAEEECHAVRRVA
jgi:beta-phosphoglucomutase